MLRRGSKGAIMPTKIRKRRCSSSSSPSSSRIHSYRLNKRAIMVGKNRAGLKTKSRSTTPVPAWRITPRRNAAVYSPKYSESGKSAQPVSARRLAANLWEMNETPSCKMSVKKKNGGPKTNYNWEKMHRLLDQSHNPAASEKLDRHKTSSHHRKASSISQKLLSADGNAEVLDSMSHASFMETESRSRPHTPSGSANGSRNRLKDLSSALSTSKELLKIINRVWTHAGQPSSTMSLISALHSELERARLQANQLMQEQRSDNNEINYLIRCFSQERASWKNKEYQRFGAAIATIASELDMEKKSRRQLESLNKKLGQELAEIKSSFIKTIKELESEKRAREVTEQVCDELERNINEDRIEKERESVKVYEELEKERMRLELAEARHQHEEKNTSMNKVRKQLEVFLATKKDRDEGRTSYFGTSNLGSHQNEQKDDGDVEDAIESVEDSAESDLHSIELNMVGKNKYKDGYKWDYNSAFCLNSTNLPVNNDIKARKSFSGQDSRRSISLLRSMSGDLDKERLRELQKEAQTRSSFEEIQRYRTVKDRRDNMLLSTGLPPAGAYHSTYGHRDPVWPLRHHCDIVPERSGVRQETSTMSGMKDSRVEGKSIRRSKW